MLPTKTELPTTRFAVLYMLGTIYSDMYCYRLFAARNDGVPTVLTPKGVT